MFGPVFLLNGMVSPAAAIRRLGHVRLALRLIWLAAGTWTAVWLGLLILQGLVPAAIVLLTKVVVDAIAEAVGTGATWENALPVLIPAALMAGVMLLQRILGALQEWVTTAQGELVGDHVKDLIHRRAALADFGFYESSAYHDQLEQVNSQASGRTLQLLNNIGGILQAGVTFGSIAVILLHYSIWVPLLLIFSALPVLAVVVGHNRVYHRWWKEATPRRRQAHYHDLLLTIDQAAAEVRLFDLGRLLGSRYQAVRRSLREERLKLLRNQVLAKMAAAAIALLFTGGALLWIALRALRGLATIGDVALFYQAFNQGQALIGGLFQNIGQIYTNTLFLEHLFEFLDQTNTVEDPSEPEPFPTTLREGVRLENVTFRYPQSARPALSHFSLEIPAGKTVAIVGENGAGKSTFIKLLCRFYDPQEGRVLIDGVDLRQFSQHDLRRHISVMFQFPMRYQMTAAENIRMGDHATDHSRADIEAAARAGGSHETIMRLPNGYDSIIGRWFETGEELSGGEWQRVALSRAFLRQAPLVILDEPTSFMDSWAEIEWLRRFKDMVRGRTALIITHRFTTAMQADIIHVMDAGNIIESGTHTELLARDGHYAASWRAQMEQVDDQQPPPIAAIPV
jgi:ATP-binding cassette, subfamily B, bacterial